MDKNNKRFRIGDEVKEAEYQKNEEKNADNVNKEQNHGSIYWKNAGKRIIQANLRKNVGDIKRGRVKERLNKKIEKTVLCQCRVFFKTKKINNNSKNILLYYNQKFATQ